MGLGFGSGCLGAGCFGSVCFGTWGCLMSSLMFIVCLYEKEKGGDFAGTYILYLGSLPGRDGGVKRSRFLNLMKDLEDESIASPFFAYGQK